MARPFQVSALNNIIPYRELYKNITQTTYTAQPEDNNDVIIFNAAANATLILPPARRVEGMIFNVWNNNSSTFTVTIDPHGSETIDGQLTISLDVNEAAKLYSYQGRWITSYTSQFNKTKTAIASAGPVITDDTSTNSNRYILFDDATSGVASTIGTSSTKLYYIPSTGTLNATVFNSLSDETLKNNIKKITDATELIKLLDGVEFEWKDNNKKSSGLIAQWIEKVLPHLVDENIDTKIKTVNYSGMIAYLVESIKELDERVKKLETDKNNVV